jgi:hypothetical protein
MGMGSDFAGYRSLRCLPTTIITTTITTTATTTTTTTTIATTTTTTSTTPTPPRPAQASTTVSLDTQWGCVRSVVSCEIKSVRASTGGVAAAARRAQKPGQQTTGAAVVVLRRVTAADEGSATLLGNCAGGLLVRVCASVCLSVVNRENERACACACYMCLRLC